MENSIRDKLGEASETKGKGTVFPIEAVLRSRI